MQSVHWPPELIDHTYTKVIGILNEEREPRIETMQNLKHACEECTLFLKQSNLPESDFITKISSYTKKLDLGGLKTPCKEILYLIMHCAYFYEMYKNFILHNGISKILELILVNVKINFSPCFKGCDLKNRIVRHFFTVRSYCVKSYVESKKRKIVDVYGSASSKRTRVQ